jgi:hypothetical protein
MTDSRCQIPEDGRTPVRSNRIQSDDAGSGPDGGASDALQGGLDGEVVGRDDVGVRFGPTVGVDRVAEELDQDPKALGLGAVLLEVLRTMDPIRRQGGLSPHPVPVDVDVGDGGRGDLRLRHVPILR